MNTFHTKFNELGQSLTGVVEQSRALKNPFNTLGRKLSMNRRVQLEARELKLRQQREQRELLQRLRQGR